MGDAEGENRIGELGTADKTEFGSEYHVRGTVVWLMIDHWGCIYFGPETGAGGNSILIIFRRVYLVTECTFTNVHVHVHVSIHMYMYMYVHQSVQWVSRQQQLILFMFMYTVHSSMCVYTSFLPLRCSRTYVPCAIFLWVCLHVHVYYKMCHKRPQREGGNPYVHTVLCTNVHVHVYL